MARTPRQIFHFCTIALHPELNLETVHIGGSASLLLPQASITFGDLSAEVTGPG